MRDKSVTRATWTVGESVKVSLQRDDQAHVHIFFTYKSFVKSDFRKRRKVKQQGQLLQNSTADVFAIIVGWFVKTNGKEK